MNILWLYKILDYAITINKKKRKKKGHLTNMHFKELMQLSQASNYSPSRSTMQLT